MREHAVLPGGSDALHPNLNACASKCVRMV
jgi:hypothetical protein